MIPGAAKREMGVLRLQAWLLAGWVALVLSASLYPFDWDWGRLAEGIRGGFPQLREWIPPSRRDTIVNLLLYVPCGLLGALALDPAAHALKRFLWPILGAAALSLSIEVAQHALPPRDPSLADWVLNALSATSGTLLAFAYRALPRRALLPSTRSGESAASPALGILAALWIAAHLAPFVPRLRPGRISAAFADSLALDLVPSRVVAWLACYLVLAAAVRAVAGWRDFWSGLLVITVASLGLRLLFVGQRLSPDEVAGALLALPLVALLGLGRARWNPTKLFLTVCAAMLLSGLIPVSGPAPGDTSWLPFAQLAGGAADPGALPLMERLFLGIGLAWLAWTSRTTPLPPLGIALLVTLVAEFLQQWVPGRLPDTSDLAALLIGAALVQAAPPPRLRP
jgi:VanZ family protein